MKGLVTLFLALAFFGIAWGYVSKKDRSGILAAVRKNLFPIVFALLAVAVAIFVSTNTTLRFL